MELISSVFVFDWGTIGNDSVVAQLAAHNNPDFKLDKTMHYAQLCIGSLKGALTNYTRNGEEFTADLPYMLKVLSIAKATSIHVHPNQIDAEFLHKKEPQVYRHTGSKPEMIIALTPFVAVCSFRPLSEIKDILLNIYPLRRLVVGDSDDFDLLEAGDEQGLRNCFRTLMQKELDAIAQCVEAISKDFGKEMCKYDVLDIFNILKGEFRKDVGVILIFFLNVIRLQPGEAMFADAGEMHAYLSGECIEFLTPSENVIRTGLTTKYKDVKQLCQIVNYKGLTVEEVKLKPEHIGEQRLLFKPPIEDFAVTQIILRPIDQLYVLQIEQQPGIMLVISGQRTLEVNGVKQAQLKRGSILFLPYEVGTELRFVYSGEGEENFVAFITTPNVAPVEPSNDPPIDQPNAPPVAMSVTEMAN